MSKELKKLEGLKSDLDDVLSELGAFENVDKVIVVVEKAINLLSKVITKMEDEENKEDGD